MRQLILKDIQNWKPLRWVILTTLPSAHVLLPKELPACPLLTQVRNSVQKLTWVQSLCSFALNRLTPLREISPWRKVPSWLQPSCAVLLLLDQKSLGDGPSPVYLGFFIELAPKRGSCFANQLRSTVVWFWERILEPYFSKFHIHRYHLRIVVNCSSWFRTYGCRLGFLLSNKLPGAISSAGPLGTL